MRDIRASAEVLALIGAEKLRELHGDAFIPYRCWQCGRGGRSTEPTSVVVLGYRVFRAVRLTHAACANSQIISVNVAGWAVDGNCHTATPPASPRNSGYSTRAPTRHDRPLYCWSGCINGAPNWNFAARPGPSKPLTSGGAAMRPTGPARCGTGRSDPSSARMRPAPGLSGRSSTWAGNRSD